MKDSEVTSSLNQIATSTYSISITRFIVTSKS